MNFYGLKSYFCLLLFTSFSSHIVTAIQEKAQPCQIFTFQKTGSNSTVVEPFEVWWFYSNTIHSMVGTSAF